MRILSWILGTYGERRELTSNQINLDQRPGDCLPILIQQKLLSCLSNVNLKLANSIAYFKETSRLFFIDFHSFLLMHASSFIVLFSLSMSHLISFISAFNHGWKMLMKSSRKLTIFKSYCALFYLGISALETFLS